MSDLLPVGMEFANNPEPRCPCILLLDSSTSMAGTPIQELNAGLRDFEASVNEDRVARMRVEVAVIAFSSSVTVIQDFVTVDEFTPPVLTADGMTAMGQALREAMQVLDERKSQYKANNVPYYRPWIFLITDGAPTDAWESVANDLHQYIDDKGALFFAVGTEEADIGTLKAIAGNSVNGKVARLKGMEFRELFKWVSRSLSSASKERVGSQIALEDISNWGIAET